MLAVILLMFFYSYIPGLPCNELSNHFFGKPSDPWLTMVSGFASSVIGGSADCGSWVGIGGLAVGFRSVWVRAG